MYYNDLAYPAIRVAKNTIKTKLGFAFMTTSHSDLLQLKNLGAASVNILRAIGIHSCEDLKQVGPVQAYIRIKLRGIHVSKVMLYALEGALRDVHWNDLDAEQKQQLVAQAEQALTTPPPPGDAQPMQRH